MKLWHVNAPGGAEVTERPLGSGRYHFGSWYEGSDFKTIAVPLSALQQHGWSTSPLPNSIQPGEEAEV